MSEVLFACSHCFKRLPFHKLTQDNHYCETCYLVTLRRCRFCLNCYSPGNKNLNACGACYRSIRRNGWPHSCKMCNLKAAFEGSKCDRCYNYCRKYGHPRRCSECKCHAAFIKSRADWQFDRRLLCWLCDHNLKSSTDESIKESNGKNTNNSQYIQRLSSFTDNATTTSSSLQLPKTLPTIPAPLQLKQSPSSPASTTSSISTIEFSHANQILMKNSNKTLASDLKNGNDRDYRRKMVKNKLLNIELPERKMRGLSSTRFNDEVNKLKNTVKALKKRIDMQDKNLIEKNIMMNALGAEMQDRESRLMQQLCKVNNREKQQFEGLNRQVIKLTKENALLKRAMKVKVVPEMN